jgi:hypothetical protein
VPVPQREAADELLSKGTGWWLEVQGGTVASLELWVPAGWPDCGAHGPTSCRSAPGAGTPTP